VALSALGLVSFLQLKLALFPDITFPVVVVHAHTTEFDPQANERSVTDPLETALRGKIKGITRIESSTYPEFVVITLNFDIGADLAQRRDQVADAIATVKLPAGTTTGVTPINLNETYVVTYALSGKGRSMAQLASLAQSHLAPRLRALPGVLKVEIVGGASSGTASSAYLYDGQPAVAVAVVKKAGANALDVAEASDDTVSELVPTLGAKVVRASSQATFIREASRATQEALGLAVLLAILVILPFLWDLRATAISAMAIPVSLLGTAIVMRLLHFNLETITLLALALVVGVIVDDAIVAVENIVRHLEEGETPYDAAFNANKEIGRTLVATTLTIVAVFLPIGLMRGTLGQFFKPFGLTASAAVLFSLLAARTLSPTLGAAFLRARKTPADAPKRERHPNYRRGLEWALGHRKAVMALAALAFAAGLALIPFIPKGFIPHLDRGEFDVNVQAPVGTSLAETLVSAAQVERAVRGDPDVLHTYTTVGARAGVSNAALIVVGLKPDRSAKTNDVENRVRKLLPQIDGVTINVADVPFVGSDTSKPFEIALLSKDLATLRDVGRSFEHRVQKIAGFVEVTAAGLSDGTPFAAIEHVNGQRAVLIQSDLDPNLRIGDANDEVASLAHRVLPKTVKFVFGGSSEDVVTTFRDFGLALGLSIVAIVAVLVVLFRSWLDPLVITVALPLSIVGALFALWITHSEFGLISLMGVVFLFGLVNKNAILLVDSIKRLRHNGLERRDAILAAGSQRLRPILMTTAATILGMLPIALGFGAGAELRSPMAIAIIGGLITSTMLSLIVVPVTYTLVDDLEQRLARKP
jgi:multidrug efflux pump subunit AcrB